MINYDHIVHVGTLRWNMIMLREKGEATFHDYGSSRMQHITPASFEVLKFGDLVACSLFYITPSRKKKTLEKIGRKHLMKRSFCKCVTAFNSPSLERRVYIFFFEGESRWEPLWSRPLGGEKFMHSRASINRHDVARF